MPNPCHLSIFSDYFKHQFWANKDGSSGPNSAFDATPILRENLQYLLEKNNITTLYDAGCGDCNLFKHLPLDFLTHYIGVECVSGLTEQNKAYFAMSKNCQFKTADVCQDTIPEVDLILCRDVLHYLPNAKVLDFMTNCLNSDSHYLLVTHNTHAPVSANVETEVGIFRPVNLTQAPFSWPTPIETIKEDTFAKELALFDLQEIKRHAPRP